MTRTFALIGAVNAFLSVALGAFGAHALRDRLSPEMLTIFHTGVQYHQMHALALLLIAALASRYPGKLVAASGWLISIGIGFFAGSLYALALSGVRVWGAVTPIGGVCFLTGWALLAVAVWKGGDT